LAESIIDERLIDTTSRNTNMSDLETLEMKDCSR